MKLAFGGDVAGQNVCRDAVEGFPIFDTVRSWRPDVFVGLGDMVYADNGCEPTGRYGNPQVGGVGIATDLAGFVQRLQAIDATGGPEPGKRARALVDRDPIVRRDLAILVDRDERRRAAALWDDALRAERDAASSPPVWVHGDLLPANVVVRDGRVVAMSDVVVTPLSK